MSVASIIRSEELPPLGIVSRVTAEREREIQRYADWQRRKEDLVQVRVNGAIKSDARRKNRLVGEEEKLAVLSEKEIGKAHERDQLEGGRENKAASLTNQIDMLRREAALQEESMHLMAMKLNRSEHSNKKRIARLKKEVMKLRKDANDYPEQIRHWQKKALDFSKQIYILEMGIEEKEDQVGDLIEYKQIQDGKIDEMEKEAAKLRSEIQKSSEKEKSFRRENESNIQARLLEAKASQISLEMTQMETELDTMRLLLKDANSKAQRKESKAKPKVKRRLEDFMHQFSCRECFDCPKVVVTTRNIRDKASEIAELSAVMAVASTRISGSPFNFRGLSAAAAAATIEDVDVYTSSSLEKAFVEHIASHVPKKAIKSELNAFDYCKEIIKVESLTTGG